jgi:hypothetical protein
MEPGIDVVTSKLLRQSNRIGVDFLLADLDSGHIALDIADLTEVADTRTRNQERARYIYLTILRLLPHVKPDPEEHARINERLAQLKKRLVDAGLFK